jgi:vaccinia related kinase
MKRATTAEMEQPNKSVAANGSIFEGEILIDGTKNQWKLGKSIGVGGFGEVYLASSNTYEPVGSDAQHAIKVESLKSGTLSVEINFYRRVAKSNMIDEWKKRRMLTHLGLPHYIGSGSRNYKYRKYRFLVLQRYGQDLNQLLEQYGKFPVKTVCYLGIQILNSIEYIHSHGYIHADIKAHNLLLGYHRGTENRVYILDFGLAGRYLDKNGVHKNYACNECKAHAGTLEYVSRDGHIGAFSRRGDLETLSYNIIEWLGGKLPWKEEDDADHVQFQKLCYMSNIPQFMHQCFHNLQPPPVLNQFLKYVASLNFKIRPSYVHCRNLLRQGVKDSGCVDDGMLVFGDNPEKQVKECVTQNFDLPTTIAGKYEPVVLVKRL